MTKALLFFALLLIAFGRVSPALADPPAVASIALSPKYDIKKNKLVGETTTFVPTDHDIFCVLRLKGIAKNSDYTVRWFVVKLDKPDPLDGKIFNGVRYKTSDWEKAEHEISFDTVSVKRANLLNARLTFNSPSNWPTGAGVPPVPTDWPEG